MSVTSKKRSFSKLKLIKEYLRATMGQSHLSDVGILSLESELARSVDFKSVIHGLLVFVPGKLNCNCFQSGLAYFLKKEI